MKQIWKFPLEYDEFTAMMPKDAKVLSAQLQGSFVCLWAMVETGNKNVPRSFRIIGTGNPIDTPNTDPELELRFIDTIQNNGFVMHVFEVKS